VLRDFFEGLWLAWKTRREWNVFRDRLAAVAESSQPTVRDKWLKLVLSTDPVELCRAQAAIKSLWRPPQTVLVCESPVSAALTMSILRAPPIVRLRGNYQDEDFLKRHTIAIPEEESVDRLRGRFPDEWSSAWKSAKIVSNPQQIGRQVTEDQMVNAAHIRLRLYQSKSGLREKERNRDLRNWLLEICWQGLPEVQRAHDALWRSLRAGVPNELLAYVESLRSYVIFDTDEYDLLPCLIEYDYLVHVCGKYCMHVDIFCRIYKRDLAALLDLAQSCAGWVLYENVAILLDRPCEINLDSRRRLHNANGMAVKYRDGWGVYCWRGVTVSREVIEHPENITVQEIELEPVWEIQRVKIERYGFDRYVRDAKVQEIQRDDSGILYRQELASGAARLFVKVLNASAEADGTRKEYVLPVPSKVQTAHEAVVSTMRQRVEDYWPCG